MVDLPSSSPSSSEKHSDAIVCKLHSILPPLYSLLYIYLCVCYMALSMFTDMHIKWMIWYGHKFFRVYEGCYNSQKAFGCTLLCVQIWHEKWFCCKVENAFFPETFSPHVEQILAVTDEKCARWTMIVRCTMIDCARR